MQEEIQPRQRTVSKHAENIWTKFLYQLSVVFGVFFVFSIFFGRVLFFPISVEGYSMKPTLNFKAIGASGNKRTDTVYVGNFGEFGIGDIVVFDTTRLYDSRILQSEHSEELKYFIKRIVGAPGDTISFSIVEVKDEYVEYVLCRNEAKVSETFLPESMKCFPSGTVNDIEFYQTFLAGNKKIVLEKDEYFLMGDNRNFSTDSRFVGAIYKKEIVGKVYLHIPWGNSIIESIFRTIFSK